MPGDGIYANRKDRRQFNPPFPLTLGMSFAAKLVVCLKLPSLSLFLEKVR